MSATYPARHELFPRDPLPDKQNLRLPFPADCGDDNRPCPVIVDLPVLYMFQGGLCFCLPSGFNSLSALDIDFLSRTPLEFIEDLICIEECDMMFPLSLWKTKTFDLIRVNIEISDKMYN